MINISDKSYEFGQIISISNQTDSFNIFLGGNGDLYFSPVFPNQDILNSDKPFTITIDKSNVEIFSLFDTLYTKIINYEPFESENELLDKSLYEKKRDSLRKYSLVKDGIISWYSDDYDIEKASLLNISKVDDEIKLDFFKSRPDDELDATYSIRFCNSGSRYEPFNSRFMILYNSLCEMELEKNCSKCYKKNMGGKL